MTTAETAAIVLELLGITEEEFLALPRFSDEDEAEIAAEQAADIARGVEVWR